jgi:putative membrane protein
MADAIAASLHYLSIFVLFSLLTCEHVLFKAELDVATARRLLRIDMIYGATAGVVLLTGLARVIWFGKGLDYYLHNWVFHAKVSLFILVGLLSILPTLTFFNWRNDLLAGKAPTISPAQAKRTIMVIRLELLILVCLPFLASLMARGVGFFVS